MFEGFMVKGDDCTGPDCEICAIIGTEPATPTAVADAAPTLKARTMRQIRKGIDRLNSPATDSGDEWLDSDGNEAALTGRRIMRGSTK
jgi:uncharacterized Zn-binding protein involved in type VI secretion